MRIGIIGPSKIEKLEKINDEARKMISDLAVDLKDFEIVLTADKGSVSEYFGEEYLEAGGTKLFSVLPVDDKEFGNEWVNKLGKTINCGTWRNQPEKLNEESDAIVCLGYSAGGLIEMAYSRWFNKKPVYVVKEFISAELPEEAIEGLDVRYVSIDELELEDGSI